MIICVEDVDLSTENETSLFVKDLIKSLINLSYDLTDDKNQCDFTISFKDFPKKVLLKSDKCKKNIYHTHNNKSFIYPGISLDIENSTIKSLYEIKGNKKIIVFENYDNFIIEKFKNDICVVFNKVQKCKHKNVFFIDNADQKTRKMIFCISDLFISESLYIDRFCAESLSQGCSIYNKLLSNKIPDNFLTLDFNNIKKIDEQPYFLSIEKTANYYNSVMKRMYNKR